MIKISKKSQYGLRAMVYLAKEYNSKKYKSLREISLNEGMPFDFLEKIISRLEKAGLVKSKKGIQGGYMICKNPSKINAGDIVMALEENKQAVDCAFCGRIKHCKTKGVWKKVELAINKSLKEISLKDLIS